jgi:IS30 family transposase
MRRVPKRSTSEVTRALIWDRWGIRPPPRRRSERVLKASERELISRGLVAGCSMREIARHLKRAPSSISREIARSGGVNGYRAVYADERAWWRARRPKRCVLARDERLRGLVTAKLLIDWSPQQISGWLKKAYADDESMRVSHETIYRSLFIQARGALKKELTAHLRRGRSVRRARNVTNKTGLLVDAVSIRQRPADAEDRAIPGHWEGDLLCGTRSSQIATLVERKSRFVMLVKAPTKSSELLVGALSKQVRKLPSQLRASLSWDRGFEMRAHKNFTLATEMQVYFCDPYSPWQRGTNENTNGLLRQYFPKSTDVSQFSQEQLDEVAMRLNQRPRKTLNYETPAYVFAQSVAVTG